MSLLNVSVFSLTSNNKESSTPTGSPQPVVDVAPSKYMHVF